MPEKTKRNPRTFQPIRYGSWSLLFMNEHILNVNLLPNEFVMVDIGSCVCQNIRFLKKKLRSKKPKAFYAFEPNPKCRNYLSYWSKRGVTIYEGAIGSTSDKPRMKFFDYTSPENDRLIGWGRLESTPVYDQRGAGSNEFMVQVFSFNDLLGFIKEKRIDYMIMDVEGHEKQILTTADSEVLSKIDQFSFEVHDRSMMDRYQSILSRAGFQTILKSIGSMYACKQLFCDRGELE